MNCKRTTILFATLIHALYIRSERETVINGIDIMEYLVTFFDNGRVLEYKKMSTDEVLKMYEAMLNNERFNDDLDYPSHLFAVDKLECVTDNS